MNSRRSVFEAPLKRILSPFEDFLRSNTAGGIVLITATVLALGLAYWLGDQVIHHFWGTTLYFGAQGGFHATFTWHRVVNDGLMVLFFLLVGLELKREILVGELSSLRDAALPVIAATGGMVVPALIYLAFNYGTPTVSGWGIPMATDIAFAIGILVLLAWRAPRNLIVFLTALAIADDLGAVLVIALFYSGQLDMIALGYAVAFFGLLIGFNFAGLRQPLPYALVGILLWYAVLVSGVHATIAGILLAFAIPARSWFTASDFEQKSVDLLAAFREQIGGGEDDPLRNARITSIAESVEHTASAVQSPLLRIEHGLNPWVTFFIVPVFALSNAGIDLGAVNWSGVFAHRVTLGVVLGLVVGKFIGIAGFSGLAVRLGLGRLPSGVTWKHLLGSAWLGGIGFTMSLFISQLAFKDPAHIEQAKLGILCGSALSAVIGLAWLFVSAQRAGNAQDSEPL